tara:strand:- start:346 stop:471 length:126 start_codon:yes stop_codon:yes gene_type:complete
MSVQCATFVIDRTREENGTHRRFLGNSATVWTARVQITGKA